MYYPVAVPSHLHYGVRVNDLLMLEDKIVVREHLVAFSVWWKVTQMMHKHHIWHFLFLQRYFGGMNFTVCVLQRWRGSLTPYCKSKTNWSASWYDSLALAPHVHTFEAGDLSGGSRTIISLIAVQTSSRYFIGSNLRSQVCNFQMIRRTPTMDVLHLCQTCGKEAMKQCSCCHLVAYCDVECHT